MARPKLYDDDLRARLVGEASRVIETDGTAALSVRRTAQAAGTSTTAVYSLFGSMDGLRRAVLIDAFERFTAAQESITPSDDPFTDVAGLGMAYVQWALDNPKLYELMFGQSVAGIETSPELDAAGTRAIAPLTGSVTRAIEGGVFVAADVATVVTSLWAQVHGLATLMLAGKLPPGADPAAASLAILTGWSAPQRVPVDDHSVH